MIGVAQLLMLQHKGQTVAGKTYSVKLFVEKDAIAFENEIKVCKGIQ